jgi:hypothetical protein
MGTRRGSNDMRVTLRVPLSRGWRWQAIVAVILALIVAEGRPVAASYATDGAARAAGHVARAAGRVAKLSPRADETSDIGSIRDAAVASTDGRPDFVVTFTRLDDAQAGRPFSYTLQVRNDGGTGGAVAVSTVLPPEISNVRVTAPGFACTRRFSASGPQAGTLVACQRGDLESGAVAEVLVEANAPATIGAIYLTATADPRDDILESDEMNNEVDATVVIH